MFFDDDNNNSSSSSGPSSSTDFSQKRKRKPAGTPDPNAEVVALSPQRLLNSDRFVCEICNRGFQREQNLQMHRRRHKVPLKLLKRERPEPKKRVYVCPEPSCLYHNPCHALGDLVGLKKHFRRKHTTNKQWVCEKCGKGYAVESDYKAHLKTCGSRGHTCDCGLVFSRLVSFIAHQDSCIFRLRRPYFQAMRPDSSFHAAGTTSGQTTDTDFSAMPAPNPPEPHHNLELQLLPSSYNVDEESHHHQATNLNLSIGSSSQTEITESKSDTTKSWSSNDQVRIAMAERVYAEEARQQAKRQLEMAELEFSNAKRIRQQALAELEKAHALKEQATKRISETISEITCHSCRQRFHQATAAIVSADETSPAMSYMSSATTDAEGD